MKKSSICVISLFLCLCIVLLSSCDIPFLEQNGGSEEEMKDQLPSLGPWASPGEYWGVDDYIPKVKLDEVNITIPSIDTRIPNDRVKLSDPLSIRVVLYKDKSDTLVTTSVTLICDAFDYNLAFEDEGEVWKQLSKARFDLTLKEDAAPAGEIKIEISSSWTEPAPHMAWTEPQSYDMSQKTTITIYYATSGEYIAFSAYSLESAMKMADSSFLWTS